MNQNKLFQLTRVRLALWYAIAMALILSLCGFGVYKAVSHAHWVALDQEVESALLMPHLDETEAREILETLQRQNQRLTILVTDLLLLVRLDRQPIPMRRELCCLNEIVSDHRRRVVSWLTASEQKLI